jgi:predicted nucleic acid-binding protein
MRYVLDTNTCIYALTVLGRVVGRMREHLPSEIAITTITLAELWFGARKSTRRVAVRREVDASSIRLTCFLSIVWPPTRMRESASISIGLGAPSASGTC